MRGGVVQVMSALITAALVFSHDSPIPLGRHFPVLGKRHHQRPESSHRPGQAGRQGGGQANVGGARPVCGGVSLSL